MQINKKLCSVPITLTLSIAFSITLFTTLFTPQASFAAAPDLSCPDKPNCVSSKMTGDHYIEPLKLTGTPVAEIKSTLETLLKSWPKTEITNSTNNILKAVVTSKWMEFKDDLILVINPDGVIDVRSSSRSGYYDFGVNRDRVEQLRTELTK